MNLTYYIKEKSEIVFNLQFSEKATLNKEKIKLSPNAQDTIDALQVLGYNRRDIEETVAKINTIDMSVEEIIKEGLKQLGR